MQLDLWTSNQTLDMHNIVENCICVNNASIGDVTASRLPFHRVLLSWRLNCLMPWHMRAYEYLTIYYAGT